MIFYGKSDVGVVRLENQDCFGIFDILPEITLAVICDGMGGNAGGSVASRLALETFADKMRENLIPDSPEEIADLKDQTVRRALRLSAEEANRAVWQKARERQDGKLDGMGTTLTAVLAVGNSYAWWVNVGDSRIYRISGDELLQVTHDHSYVQQLVDIGELTADQAAGSPYRNYITRAIGAEPTVEADVGSIDIVPGYTGERIRLLLCSDGLYGCVGKDKLLSVVNSDEQLSRRAELLVNAARRQGGPDNITVILAE
jgi:protein phosphatase